MQTSKYGKSTYFYGIMIDYGKITEAFSNAFMMNDRAKNYDQVL